MPKFEEPKRKAGERVVGLAKANSGREHLPAKLQDAAKAADRQEAKALERRIAPERIFQARCAVCKHPFRDWIELMLIRGMQYKTLADRVSPPVSRDSLRNHYKKHMDLQDTAFRQIIEAEAELQGAINEEGTHDLVTKRSVLEIAMRKGFEDILNDVTTVEPRDLIQISKVLADMDAHQYEVGLDELRSQVQLFIQAIKDVCDPETQGAIGQRVKELRQREGIIGKVDEKMMIGNGPEQAISQAKDQYVKGEIKIEEYEEIVEASVVEESISSS